MKIATIIVRILMGLLFLFASGVYFLKMIHEPELKGSAKVFMEGVAASVYLMPLIKITELVCSIAFLSGRFVPVAAVMLFPVTLNILLYGVFVSPEALISGIVVVLGNLFLAYAYRKNYAGLLAAK